MGCRWSGSLAAWLLLAGCARGTIGDLADGTDAADAAGDSLVAAIDEGGGPTVADVADSSDTPGYRRGQVRIDGQAPSGGTTFMAYFLEIRPGALPVVTQSQVGPCRFVDGGWGSVNVNQFTDVGTITISGGGLPPVAMPFDPAAGAYTAWRGGTFAAGDMITASADGPGNMFSGAVAFPEPIVVTAPLLSSPVNFSRSADLVVSWTGAGTAAVVVEIGSNISIECIFDRAAGTGTIPAAALASLRMGSALMSIGSKNETVVNLPSGLPTTLEARKQAFTSTVSFN